MTGGDPNEIGSGLAAYSNGSLRFIMKTNERMLIGDSGTNLNVGSGYGITLSGSPNSSNTLGIRNIIELNSVPTGGTAIGFDFAPRNF